MCCFCFLSFFFFIFISSSFFGGINNCCFVMRMASKYFESYSIYFQICFSVVVVLFIFIFILNCIANNCVCYNCFRRIQSRYRVNNLCFVVVVFFPFKQLIPGPASQCSSLKCKMLIVELNSTVTHYNLEYHLTYHWADVRTDVFVVDYDFDDVDVFNWETTFARGKACVEESQWSIIKSNYLVHWLNHSVEEYFTVKSGSVYMIPKAYLIAVIPLKKNNNNNCNYILYVIVIWMVLHNRAYTYTKNHNCLMCRIRIEMTIFNYVSDSAAT